ncbi:hypothetical protein [Paractinoplanes rishiriensis]|uniref:Uncharacterized protein n=1 Tax=Paractinoplanes rishiriensis TaxID=1050105 RepID=A0A919MUX0_9ACTN|nr:hypothetical protein [Actinoplanes rishiriensis]GIE95799.1 hypothetical protein Ari01nite_32640 [Actinoplanes rishiriensis]
MSFIRRRDNPVTLASAVWSEPHLPPRKAAREQLVTTLVAELYGTLTNLSVSDTEAYAVFLRTVAILNVYAVKEGRR